MALAEDNSESYRPPSERYQPPFWLPGGHSQTIYTALLSPRPRLVYQRERWDTPDGDFIDVDWMDTPGDGPLVAIFHGLEGSSRSHYALALMNTLRGMGWRGAAPNFRGCGGEPNRLPRAYFAGDSAEIDWILRRLRARYPAMPLFAAGFSLGGNALLKWLGEQGANACTVVDAAVAVSAPMDLHAAGNALDKDGFNLIYRTHFLRTLKKKALRKLEQFPGLFDRDTLEKITTLRTFDNLVTAPLHGFRDTDDYWTKASSKPGLIDIGVPTLIINARNDPFLPHHALPKPADVSAPVALNFPAQGGHVGFIEGPFPGKHAWLPERVTAFFVQFA
ncbi:MAG: hydrolase [Pseudomonadota bacterium]